MAMTLMTRDEYVELIDDLVSAVIEVEDQSGWGLDPDTARKRFAELKAKAVIEYTKAHVGVIEYERNCTAWRERYQTLARERGQEKL